MDDLDYWRLCDELNIVQAALLVVGENADQAEYVESWDVQNRPRGYEAAKHAICIGLKKYRAYQEELAKLSLESEGIFIDEDAIIDENPYLINMLIGTIEGSLMAEIEYDINGVEVGELSNSISLLESTVNVESLKKWLRFKGFTSGFFFPEPTTTMDFLDVNHSRYAPKLAAAVSAWQAVTDAGKKSPKQALDKWLREHAAEFNLTNDEGNPIETAIEECSKVANWNMRGGATKTPT